MAVKKKMKKEKMITEFRRDIVSSDWILVSSMRQFKPHLIPQKLKSKTLDIPIKDCPFEDPQKHGSPAPLSWLPKNSHGKAPHSTFDPENWFVQVVPNKYPVLSSKNICPKSVKRGPHEQIEGTGFHEVIITRDHKRDLSQMTIEEISLVFKIYQTRYKELEKEDCIEYVLIFHNHGELAGASIAHPHSQLVALPIIPPDVSRSINGGIDFFEKNKKCIHCAIIEEEKKEKKRIIFENESFIAFVPFAARVPYEVRIFPKKHSSDFEEIEDKDIEKLSEIMKVVLGKISKTLGHPDYNFFIHTASAKIKDVPYYHWHIEILPRTYKWAGMELGTGIEVVPIPPEEAAEQLRKAK
jgi:UDPglucose--hexose-1-phosphate uridylyltransferase